MRPSVFTDEQIIEAGRTLQGQGRPVSGFAIRQLLGGGNVPRLMQVWTNHIEKEESGTEEAQELPGEIESKVAGLQAELSKHVRQIAQSLYRQQRIHQELEAAERESEREREREQSSREVEEAQQIIDRLQEQVGRLEGELSETKQALEDSRQATQALNLEVGASRAEQRHAVEQLQKQTQLLDEQKGEIARLQEENRRRQEELHRKEIEVAQLTERLAWRNPPAPEGQ